MGLVPKELSMGRGLSPIQKSFLIHAYRLWSEKQERVRLINQGVAQGDEDKILSAYAPDFPEMSRDELEQRALILLHFDVPFPDYVPLLLPPLSRSQQATVSRVLRRLEQRGLIVRSNLTNPIPGELKRVRSAADQPHWRTTYLLLTPAGRNVAEELLASGYDLVDALEDMTGLIAWENWIRFSKELSSELYGD
jgi:hypothetical protein